ncbi:MAG: NAD+ synthase [Candidatus Omnitrophota bacterium]|nr:NAD+ synthase [Candidatus Omnitrophota bacterium]
MEKKLIRIAIAQINTTVGDLEGNYKKVVDYINKAVGNGCDIVTFPELAITGYPPEDLLLKPKFIEDNINALNKIVKENLGIVSIIGFVDRKKQNLYNSAALIYKDKICGIYHKMFLPNYGVFDEKRYFTSGNTYLVALMDGVYFGINICEDIWEDEPIRIMSRSGIKLIFNINASPYHMGKIDLRKKMLLSRTRKDNSVISYNNLVGGQDELVFDGRSMLVDGENLVCFGKPFQEDLLIHDLAISNFLKEVRLTRINSNLKLIKIPKTIASKNLKFISKNISVQMPALKEVYLALILGLQDYVKKNNFKKAVIGLSGGIDSSLTAALAVQALGKDNVIGVFMPSQFSSLESRKFALQLANNLGINFKEISIQRIFDCFKETLRDIFKNSKEDITEENLQARIRGNVLMALSNKFGWLVVTTGNKSEMSTGYATLYGDMAGGFALIKDVPKTLVFELSRFFNAEAGQEVIPEAVIKREPTAELRPNQKDSDSLPPYKILDKIIKFYVEDNLSYKEIMGSGFSRATVSKVIALIDRAEYKRRQAPPGIKITPRAFGRDRRMPITNRYKG